VKVQPRIHREAAKSAKISRRKIVSCQQRIFGVVQIRVHLWFSKQADGDEEVSWDLPSGLSSFTRTPGQRRAKRLHERGAETGKWLGMNC